MIFITFLIFTDGVYSILPKNTCAARFGRYSNISEAKEKCFSDDQCNGVLDQGCDESPNDIYLCWEEQKYTSLINPQCVYDKAGIIRQF